LPTLPRKLSVNTALSVIAGLLIGIYISVQGPILIGRLVGADAIHGSLGMLMMFSLLTVPLSLGWLLGLNVRRARLHPIIMYIVWLTAGLMLAHELLLEFT